MAYGWRFRLACVLTVLLLQHLNEYTTASQESERKAHIVYLGEVPSEGDFKIRAASNHHDMLQHVLESHEAAAQSLIYSYGKSFNGFAAMLSPSEVKEFSNMDGVVSVFENKRIDLLTTRSWDFIGFPQSVKRNLQYESDVIIGMIDTGIWPESESFDDAGFGPVPSKWKGKCQTSSNFTACNKKLIGASFYNKGTQPNPMYDFISPRDSFGHGTHTASTAGGNVVNNASLLGLAQGNARGGVPGARIAVYKVCWTYGGCSDVDILAAFDDAIHDGVDIISVSLGTPWPLDYFEDSIAIGSFHAMKRGILTSNAAGNSGPERGTVSNYSPWSLTVAASTIDRQFHSELVLGNNNSIRGDAINTFSMDKPWYALIYGGDAPNISGGFSADESRYCELNSLDHTKVKGKIVVCELDGDSPDEVVFLSGGAGVVVIYDVGGAAFPVMIPGTYITEKQAEELKAYVKSTSSPVATILKTDQKNYSPAPAVIFFSSRGPNPITGSILKPDISAPGVGILASWSKASSVTELPEDKRFVDFNIISGTSMACPHASGAAGYVKSFHPDWSPAAIKSALMTTAYVMDTRYNGDEDAELAFGSGQIDPLKAAHPGLVYDIEVDSYIAMLCGQGYNTTAMGLVTGDKNICSKVPGEGIGALNYPSMAIAAEHAKPISATFLRTVTNVGPAKSTYKVTVNAPSGVHITVQPTTLLFTSPNQTLQFTVKVEGDAIPANTFVSGALTWTFEEYIVRSPIFVHSIVLESFPPNPTPAQAPAPAPAPVDGFTSPSSLHHKTKKSVTKH